MKCLKLHHTWRSELSVGVYMSTTHPVRFARSHRSACTMGTELCTQPFHRHRSCPCVPVIYISGCSDPSGSWSVWVRPACPLSPPTPALCITKPIMGSRTFRNLGSCCLRACSEWSLEGSWSRQEVHPRTDSELPQHQGSWLGLHPQGRVDVSVSQGQSQRPHPTQMWDSSPLASHLREMPGTLLNAERGLDLEQEIWVPPSSAPASMKGLG